MIDFLFDEKRSRADDIIDELIEKVAAAYPENRLERIRARSANMTGTVLPRLRIPYRGCCSRAGCT